jgi:hypothetical protein
MNQKGSVQQTLAQFIQVAKQTQAEKEAKLKKEDQMARKAKEVKRLQALEASGKGMTAEQQREQEQDRLVPVFVVLDFTVMIRYANIEEEETKAGPLPDIRTVTAVHKSKNNKMEQAAKKKVANSKQLGLVRAFLCDGTNKSYPVNLLANIGGILASFVREKRQAAQYVMFEVLQKDLSKLMELDNEMHDKEGKRTQLLSFANMDFTSGNEKKDADKRLKDMDKDMKALCKEVNGCFRARLFNADKIIMSLDRQKKNPDLLLYATLGDPLRRFLLPSLACCPLHVDKTLLTYVCVCVCGFVKV